VASDGQLWVSRALATIEALKEDTRHATLLERVDEDVQNVRTKARQVADTLRQRSHGRQETAQGAELLLLATVLQQYSADVEETDMEVLEVCMVYIVLESL
jgi:DNA polymerase phi